MKEQMNQSAKSTCFKIIAIFVSVMMLWVLLLFEVYASEEDVSKEPNPGESSDKITLYGKIFDMGYEFDKLDSLTNNFTIIATDSQGKSRSLTTRTGDYRMELDANETYIVKYSAYINGRMANLKLTLKFTADEDKEMNLAVRTKNVPGNEEFNKFFAPTSCVIFRNLNQPFFLDDTISFEKSNYTVRLKDTKEMKAEVVSDSGIVYDSNSFQLESLDESVVKIESDGKLVPVKKGKAEIKVTLINDEQEEPVTATAQVEVTGGFDYTRDGYCFANSAVGFYTYTENNKKEIDNDYVIPFERFQEVFGQNITKTYWSIFHNTSWGGNCFGMSLSSILFYYGKLNPSNYSSLNYDKGETVNEGLYDKVYDKVYDVVNDKEDIYYNNVGLNYDKNSGASELTKMIERYQILQYEPKWKDNHKMEFNKILENWDSDSVYIVCVEDGRSFSHAVVLQTNGDLPVADANGTYKLSIYDPNYPAFTDMGQVDYESIYSSEQRYLEYTPAKGESGKDKFVITSANDASEENICEGNNIKFIKVDDAPLSFSVKRPLLTTAEIILYCDVPKEIKIALTPVNIWYGLDSISQFKNFIVDYISSGDERVEALIYCDEAINEIKLTAGSRIAYHVPDGENVKVYGVNVEEDTVVKLEDTGMVISTDKQQDIMVLTENHKKDGMIYSVLAEGNIGAGNELSVSMMDDEFNVSAEKNMEMKLTFNTQDASVDENTIITAGMEEIIIDISEFLENPQDQIPSLNENIFEDIQEKDWYYECAKYVYGNGLMTGKGKDENGKIIFDPNKAIPREEFVQVLYNASGKPAVNIENEFPDVKDTWNKNAVLWAKTKDIVNGKGNGDFGVTESICRQDLALMLYKYARLNGYDLTTNTGEINKYADGQKVSSYAKTAMDWSITNGIMSGKGKKGEDISTFKLDPAGTATRAECAAMLKNFMDAYGK